MKRMATFLLILLFSAALSALSVSGHAIEQPYDSLTELAKRDFHSPLTEEEREWADKIEISIVTMGPTTPVYGWFGHSAIMVRQPGGHAILYDYGVFDNTGLDFYLNFMRGRMLYSVWATDGDWRIEWEMQQGRRVETQVLDFDGETKLAIFRFLEENNREENRTYLYHFYKDNCATRIRDILNKATDGDFKVWAEAREAEGTYRSWAERSLAHNPFISFVLNFLEGPSIDKPITLYDEMFLPERLSHAISAYAPFHARTTVLQEQDSSLIGFTTSDHSVHDDSLFLIAGLALAVLFLLLGRTPRKILDFALLFFLAFLGTLMLWGMCFSDIDVIWFNESILFVNPLLFLALFWIPHHPSRVRKLKRILCSPILLLLLLKGLFPSLFIQDNMKTILMVLPYYLTGFAAEKEEKNTGAPLTERDGFPRRPPRLQGDGRGR